MLTALNAKAHFASQTFTGTVSGINATLVGLGNCNNTTDATKPISADTLAALNVKSDVLTTYTKTETANKFTALVIASPAQLDTLKEIATA